MVTAKIRFEEDRMYYNHYRPMIKIRDDKVFNSCELIFKNENNVFAGEDIEADIVFLSQNHVIDYLCEGKTFLLYEDRKVFGRGKIVPI